MTGNVTTTAMDLVQGALLNINAFALGQAISPSVASTVMQILNDLLDSLSNDQAYIFTQQENILSWTPGKFQYSIGNPIGASPFTGNLTQNSPTITGATVPSNLIAGATLTDLQAGIPAGTTVLSVGANTVTMSANATLNSSGLDSITYTIPGDFSIARPLRIRNSYTRVTTSSASGLDYWFDCEVSFERYKEIGYKSVPGPWPYEAAYLPTFPYGSLRVYPNPTIAGQVFLYTDVILSNFASLTQAVSLPQGYGRSLKKLLALELCPIFGKTPSPQLISQCKEAKDLLKNQNIEPIVTLRYDSDLVNSRHTDAGWITHGGFV